MSRRTVVIEAPANLGLRPPAPGTVPGCGKLPGALRDQGLPRALDAVDGGVVVAPRYDLGGWEPGDGVFHAKQLAGYARRLADRLEGHVRAGDFPVVLGGDCSIVLGTALALRRIGRYGLAYLDGHDDFRHPGNSTRIGAAGGEALALVTGRGQRDLADLEGRGPLVRDADVALLGLRDPENEPENVFDELAEHGIAHAAVATVRERGAQAVAREALDRLEAGGRDGFWVHLDADVLDPTVLPAVDSAEPGGLFPGELRALLAPLVASPRCAGFQLTVYDPDRDAAEMPGARLLAELLTEVLR
ncbi:arginase family protein [Streptomyces diacarni]|uniref:arginase family protein n=1 Tax=Streptomyces diacarni TaxID=2800381 RepID=UPI003411787E